MKSIRLRARMRAVAALFVATLPLAGGSVSLNPAAVKTDFGAYAGGTVLNISVSGIVSLNSDGIDTNPDGSMANIPPNLCSACWAPGYQYFVPGATEYPSGYGGNGVNLFAGGGGNYDMYASSALGSSYFAEEGAMTTDTTNPNVMRFGAVAGTWSANPTPNSSDWFLVGYGGNFTVPSGGAHLYLIVVDTYYLNDSGSYSVSVGAPTRPVSTPLTATPEPSPAWLLLPTLLLAGTAECVRRRVLRARQAFK